MPSDHDCSDPEADSKNASVDPEQPPVWTGTHRTATFDNRPAGKPNCDKFFDIIDDEIDTPSSFSCEVDY